MVCLLVLSSNGSGENKKIIFPGKDWSKASPELQGVNKSKLKEAIQFLKNSGFDVVKEVLIARNGYLIWEDEDIDKVHGVRSVTKSFTSTILGLWNMMVVRIGLDQTDKEITDLIKSQFIQKIGEALASSV